LDSYNGVPYTGLINKGSISYDNTSTSTSLTPAVSGSNVTDGIKNYGTISESAKFANYAISGYIFNIAIHASSNGNITLINENSSTINNHVNLSDNSSSVGAIGNKAAYLQPSDSATFTNSSTINNSVNLSDNSSSVYWIRNAAAYLYFSDSSTFKNSGTINNYVILSDNSSSAGEIYNYGAYLYSSGSDNLTNSDTINNSVSLSGSSSAGEIDNIAADLEHSDSATFNNSGTINNSVNLGGGSKAAWIYNRAAKLHSYSNSYSNTFTNSGTINNSVSLSGGSRASYINNMAADLYPHDSSATFINSGTINVSTNIDTSSQTASGSKLTSVAADLFFNAPSGSITNTGTMSLSGYFTNPTNDPSSMSSAILLKVSGSTTPIIINSPGPISVSGHARALALVHSNAQLNSFGYVFNGDPTSSSYLRPIYLTGDSTLALNNTTLYAYAGNNLYFNKPYYLIDNATGSYAVTGSFSNIANKITNPYINASWYGANRSSDAAVIFNYTLKNTTPTQISDTYALVSTVNSITSQITSIAIGNAQGALTSVADSQMKPVQVASLVPVYLPSYTEPRTRAFAIPLYTKIYAGNLGFSEEASGIEFGVEQTLLKNLEAGIFGGFASSSINYSSKGDTNDSEDQNYYNLGIYTTYNTDNYYISALANYFKVTSEFSGYTGLTNNIPTWDDYSSKDFVGKLEGGYKLNLNPNIRLTPLAGVEYLSSAMLKYTTSAD